MDKKEEDLLLCRTNMFRLACSRCMRRHQQYLKIQFMTAHNFGNHSLSTGRGVSCDIVSFVWLRDALH